MSTAQDLKHAGLKATLPRVRIVTMPGLGHYPSDEKPQEFLAIVDEFLKSTL
jgi:pimeloyl-ACP methyl ester carboxylesterase